MDLRLDTGLAVGLIASRSLHPQPACNPSRDQTRVTPEITSASPTPRGTKIYR